MRFLVLHNLVTIVFPSEGFTVVSTGHHRIIIGVIDYLFLQAVSTDIKASFINMLLKLLCDVQHARSGPTKCTTIIPSRMQIVPVYPERKVYN